MVRKENIKAEEINGGENGKRKKMFCLQTEHSRWSLIWAKVFLKQRQWKCF